MNCWRYWRVHFANDPAPRWVNLDCGNPVNEPMAVCMAELAYPERGSVTSAIQDAAKNVLHDIVSVR